MNSAAVKSADFQIKMSELKMNKETFKLIKSIEAAQSQTPVNRSIFRYLSSQYIRSTLPAESAYTVALIHSLFLLRLSAVGYLLNFASVAVGFFMKFQLFSIFSLSFALLIVFVAPTAAFFITHYPLIYSVNTNNNLFKSVSVALSLAGLVLQSLGWCLMGLGLLSGSSGGIFTVLNTLNSKEWPLFVIGITNILILSASLIYSLHLEQFIFRQILLQ